MLEKVCVHAEVHTTDARNTVTSNKAGHMEDLNSKSPQWAKLALKSKTGTAPHH